jgi:multidrug efflux pump subunit AcrB
MVAILGVNSFINMPRSEDPPITGAYFYIVAVYPGASPGDMEQLIVEPLEEAINQLDDIDHLNSSMNDGVAVVNVEFNFNVDGDRKYDEVLRQVNQIRNSLPSDLYSLDVYRWSTTNVNILQYAMVSDNVSYAKLEEQAKRLKKEIEKINSIKKVDITAYPEQEIRIEINLQKIAQKGIPINDVLGAIQTNNTNIPGGDLDMGNRKFNIKTSGKYESIEDIGNTIVHSGNGFVIYLKDIARISFDYAPQTHIGRFKGKKSIFITASQKEGTNIFQVMDLVNEEVNSFENTIPEGIVVEKAFDQSINVNDRLNGLYKDFGIAILLILITLLPLGTRASIIVMNIKNYFLNVFSRQRIKRS